MKATAIGVSRMHGIGTNSGNKYDMARILVLAKLDPIHTEKTTRQCAGYEAIEVTVRAEAVQDLLQLPFPCDVTLRTEQTPSRGRLETVVTGVVEVHSALRPVKAA